jgi:nucleotide-binding universal stress UspA family protein
LPLTILVCIDGEPHSKGAIQWAIRLGLSLPAEVTALHVIDPYLKKFYNELYSQGRKQYLEYLDESLQGSAEQACKEFTQMCQGEGLEAKFKVRHGEPLQEILEELRHTTPHMLITGGKQLNAWGRFRSRNLPSRLRENTDTAISMLTVKGKFEDPTSE